MPHVTILAPDCKPAGLDRPTIGDHVELPSGCDPRRYPIIARHVFGVDPSHSIGRAAASLVTDLRFRNKIVCLLAMGKRPATELIAELAVRHGLEAEVDQLLDRYLEIDVEALDVTGARDLPPPPLHEVVGQ